MSIHLSCVQLVSVYMVDGIINTPFSIRYSGPGILVLQPLINFIDDSNSSQKRIMPPLMWLAQLGTTPI